MLLLGVALGSVAFPTTKTNSLTSTFPTKTETSTLTEVVMRTTTQTVTSVISAVASLQYNFTGRGTVTEGDLFALLGNYTTLWERTTHLQWNTNGTAFTFNATSVSSDCVILNYTSPYCTIILNGFGAAYFGGGRLWANSTQWTGEFFLSGVLPDNLVRYFSALQSFLSTRGLSLASISQSKIGETMMTNVKLVGKCTIVSYAFPDTEQVLFTLVTTTYLNTTGYYNSIYSTIMPTTETLGSSTFTSTTYVGYATAFALTSTSTNSNVIPSDLWSVTNCTFG